MSLKKHALREHTRWLDEKIIRVFIARRDRPMKVAALLLRLHYQRVYRAMRRRPKIQPISVHPKSSTDTRR